MKVDCFMPDHGGVDMTTVAGNRGGAGVRACDCYNQVSGVETCECPPTGTGYLYEEGELIPVREQRQDQCNPDCINLGRGSCCKTWTEQRQDEEAKPDPHCRAVQRKDEPGLRYDAGKARYDLVPGDAFHEAVMVYTAGAKKYEDRNWEKGMSWSRCFGSLMRHAWAFWRGEKLDPETGCHHMAHAAWNALALVAYDLRGVGTDDRPKL